MGTSTERYQRKKKLRPQQQDKREELDAKISKNNYQNEN